MRKIWHKQNYASGIRIHKTNQLCDFTENKPKQNKKVQKKLKIPNCLDPAYFIFHKLSTSKDGWSCDIRLKRKRLMSALGMFGTYTGKASIVVAETSVLAAEGSPGS